MITPAISGFTTNTPMATTREHSPSRKISIGIASKPPSRTGFYISSSPRQRPRRREKSSSNPGDEKRLGGGGARLRDRPSVWVDDLALANLDLPRGRYF